MAHIEIKVSSSSSIYLEASLAHWKRNGTNHGTKSNPKFVYISLVKMRSTEMQRGTKGPDNIGRRVWIYVKGGYAWYGSIVLLR